MMLLGGLFFVRTSLAIDKKLVDGSEKVVPTAEASKFLAAYTQAIQAKNESALVALMEPASKQCYQSSKHPEYYKSDFQKWFETQNLSLYELRKYKTTFEFHKMMSYPQSPTHLAIFNSETKIGSKPAKGFQSIEVIERNGNFFLAYRCM